MVGKRKINSQAPRRKLDERLSSDLGNAGDADCARPQAPSPASEATVTCHDPRASPSHTPQVEDQNLSAPPTSALEQSPPQAHGTNSERERHRDGRQSTASLSKSSASTILARKLAAEARHARKLAEREADLERRELELERRALQRERQVTEQELQAELAAIDASHDGASVRSHTTAARTRDWVISAAPITPSHCSNNNSIQITPEHSEHILSVQDELHASHTGNDYGNTAPVNDGCGKSSDIAELAAVIKSLAKGGSSDHRPGRKTWHIELPPFTGQATQWLAFKRTFDETKPSYTTTENLARLRHALRGDAREAVASLLVSAQEPNEIMSALELRFARPEYVVLQEISSMRALPKLTENNMNTFACRVRNCVETIRLLNKVEYLHSPELFDSMIGKLSPWMQARWRDYAIEKSDKVKLVLFSEFLERETESQVKFGPANLLNVEISSKREAQREKLHVHATSNSSTLPIDCSYCKQQHKIQFCEKFKALSIDDRWRWVRASKVCYRCLKVSPHQWKTCRVKQCNSDGCRLRHHSLLHGGSFSPVVNSKSDTSANVMCTSENSTGNSLNLEPNRNLDSSNEINSKDHVSSNITSVTCAYTAARGPRALLKVIPIVVSGPSGEVETYALLDDASTATLIDADMARRIGATGPEVSITVSGVRKMSVDTTVQIVNFYLRGRKNEELFLIEQARSIPDLALYRQSVRSDDISHYKHLSDLVEDLSYTDAVPTVLIGSPDCLLTYAKEARIGSKADPVACLTPLGWVLYGGRCSKSLVVQFVNERIVDNVHFTTEKEGEYLESIIKDQYKLDSIGINKCDSFGAENNRALQILDATSKRLPSGRFEVGLLWRSDVPQFPESYSQARRRLVMLEKKLDLDPQMKDLYRTDMQAMIDKGYAEKCEGKSLSNVLWYLPHFGVTNPANPGKLRIVHDAAAKSQGVSLNSLLLPGPDMLQSLLGILFRFRERRVAMTADIQEMFPQIKIRVEDRDAQRYLWRDDTDCEIKEYRMSSMIFGATSSPCTAHYIRNKNAIDFESTYPEAVRAILCDHYMDDYIGSVESAECAIKLASEVIVVHQQAGFIMRAWVSNDTSVLESIPTELRQGLLTSVELGTKSVRTLGLIWNPSRDTLAFQTGLQDALPETLTRRTALSHVMRVYDPLGLLGPVVIRGRILFQQTWKSGLGWDEELPPSDCELWREWFVNLRAISDLQLPRWYLDVQGWVESELHLFADASELAYACVAYWRFTYPDGKVKLSLIGSKARVTPLKPVTIPRLELQAALIAARLANTIRDEHKIKPDRLYLWTDSMTVLGWLRKDARLFKAFVAHRVGEISETTKVSEWRWVPSALNLADDATRVSSEPLDSKSRWFTGPEFLLRPQETWPVEPSKLKPDICDDEMKTKLLNVNLTTTVHSLCATVSVDPNRFSSWPRLLRATAYAIKFIQKLKDRVSAKRLNAIDGKVPRAKQQQPPLPLCREVLSVPDSLTHRAPVQGSSSQMSASSRAVEDTRHQRIFVTTCIPLTAEELKSAEIQILRSSQAECFGEEMACVRNAQPIRKGRLANLSLMIDNDGVLRLSGRIRAARGIDTDTKNPILLDGRHAATRLLVYQMHKDYAHANNETVINEIRQRFWIIRLRDTVKAVARNCQLCKMRRATPLNPPTGDLPFDHLAHHRRVFTYTGIDYFGPIEVTMFRRRVKRWGALYTCMTVRAIHLDVVHSLSTDSAIMCLRRFIARRGTPTKMLSDNATCFVGAKKQLAELYSQSVTEYAANKGIQWSFIPPAAPFMGGSWERLVRSVKTALLMTLHERAPTEEVLITLLLEAEAIVNSRPLTYVSVDPADPPALTPFHFILGTSSTATLPIQLDDGDLARRCDYKKALRLADHFWTRWMKEYLPTILPRRHTGQITPNINIGDLVIIMDGQLPRGTWPRGRVTAVFPGKDGFVRVADVATGRGTLRRPVRKLLQLPVDP